MATAIGTDRRSPSSNPGSPLATDARSRRGRGWQWLAPYAFIAPFLLVFVVFLIVPLAFALNISLYSSRLIGGTAFSGAENYLRVLQDPSFRNGLLRVGGFFLLHAPVMIVLATVMALLLDSTVLKLRKLFRLGFFLPYAIPSVIAALMWGYLYGPTFGPLAQLGDTFGFQAPNLLSSRWIVPGLANIVTWQWMGYNMLIIYAALQAVPKDLRGAALVDGASETQVAWHVKLPLIRPALVLVGVFSIIGSLQLFNEPQILRQIAPAAVGSDFTPNMYAYSLAFTSQDFNYSAAVSFVLGAVVFVVSYSFMLRSSLRERREGS